MRKIFIITIFLLSFSVIADAQQIPPSYGFVEVVDSYNKPVADASICRGDCNKISTNQAQLIEKTNQNGLMEKGIQISGDYRLPFSIYKESFYPFINCFDLQFKDLYGGWRNNKDKPIKIELLKIPQNENEKNLIEKEQQKREFFLSIYNKDMDSLRQLLKAKINPNLNTGDLRGVPISTNIPAIIYAADLANIDAIKEFLSAGVDVSAKNSTTNNILLNYLLASPYFYSQTEEERKQKFLNYENGVEILLKAGANIYARDKQNRSLLMIAVEKGHLRIAETLLKNGLSNNEENQKDLALITAIGRSIYENRVDFVQLLLKNGANPNYIIGNYDRSSECNSALMWAAAYSNLQVVELLIANGADVNLMCKSGKSVFTSALSPSWQSSNDDSLKQKREKILDLLFASGLDVKVVDDFGGTTLMKAIQSNNHQIVAKLIKMGVSVNSKTKLGETALMIAASSLYRFEIVKLLVESNADVNAFYEYKNNHYENSYNFCYTPLVYATSEANITDEPNIMPEVMQYLVKNGAKVNFKCSNGETPLTMAARGVGNIKGIKKLIELGADVKSEQGSLALKYAKERLDRNWTEPINKRIQEVVKILEAAGAKE